jgi:hypothetical protein
MDEQAKAAFAAATEVVKNTLTLSTALLALSVTYTKELNSKPSVTAVLVLEASWVLLFLAALLGVATLMAVTGTLAQSTPASGKSLYGSNIKLPMAVHFTCFLAGVALTAVFGMLSV